MRTDRNDQVNSIYKWLKRYSNREPQSPGTEDSAHLVRCTQRQRFRNMCTNKKKIIKWKITSGTCLCICRPQALLLGIRRGMPITNKSAAILDGTFKRRIYSFLFSNPSTNWNIGETRQTDLEARILLQYLVLRVDTHAASITILPRSSK
jgi:hypothetical protein